MSTTLKDALKSTSPSQKSTSGKTPAYYNARKAAFIIEMARHADEVIRIAVACSENVPSGTLKTMLELESDSDVQRTLLLNPRTPIKAIGDFNKSPYGSSFDDDEEVMTAIKARVSASE